MFNSNVHNNLYCIHSSHLFPHPLCEDQPRWQRISIIAFHVFTSGIPLTIYHVVSCCYSRITSFLENKNLQATAIDSVQQNKNIKPYSTMGLEALEFTRKKLEEYPDLTAEQFSAGCNEIEGTNQPVNPVIALLATLYWDIALKNLSNLMKQNIEDPWSNQEVINAADACMKIGFTISNLTLDDLESFTEVLLEKGENRTYAKALTELDSYQYRTFYYCTSAYHMLRGEIKWSINPYDKLDEGDLYFPQRDITVPHATSFYQKGTIQNTWNTLYNDYCDRIRLYVNENELRQSDSRHVSWTKKDTGITTFCRTPDTQPT